MNVLTGVPVTTTEQLLALPEDGVERELIRGQLRERPMTRRNYPHSAVCASVTYHLEHWLRQQPQPRGRVLTGEAGFRLRQDPDTTVGIDVAYVSADLAGRTPWRARVVEGAPVLAVEVLSPSDTQEDILDKVQEYLHAGVGLVWVIEPVYRTITVYRTGAEPEGLNVHEELSADPHLPGFRVPVAASFES